MWLRLFRPFQTGGAKIVFETATLSAPGGRLDNQDAVGYRMLDDAGCWVLAELSARRATLFAFCPVSRHSANEGQMSQTYPPD